MVGRHRRRQARRATQGRRLIKRPIVWTDEAIGNLEAITDYVRAFNPEAARRLARRLIDVADSLAEFSHRGRDAGDGRREMTIVRPYVLRYRIEADRVVILRIRHMARGPSEQA